MTARGDLWAVCMVCTPICNTFPSKGRRVSSQILLTCHYPPVPRGQHSLTGIMFSFSFVGFLCLSGCSSWVNVGYDPGPGVAMNVDFLLVSSSFLLWSFSRNRLCAVLAVYTSRCARLPSPPFAPHCIRHEYLRLSSRPLPAYNPPSPTNTPSILSPHLTFCCH